MINLSRLTLAVALVASSAVAQTRGFAPQPRFGAISRNRIVTAHGHHAFNPAYGYYGTPYFYSDYYEPSDFEYQVPEPPPPIQVQVKAEPLPDPVLLELHGSRWVKVTNFGESSDRALAGETQAQAKPLPPAILVYRDGHTEELSSYSIIGGSIHTRSNYWTTGTWTRTIPVADLDIPATLQQNQKRGVNFELPSGPDEVMLRP
ncbi:MAG TPA: hypothetical protein VHV29_20785 [Terriglobales bacterium]|nr:hypothetical protein [Terriglobales bacterium]